MEGKQFDITWWFVKKKMISLLLAILFYFIHIQFYVEE